MEDKDWGSRMSLKTDALVCMLKLLLSAQIEMRVPMFPQTPLKKGKSRPPSP